MKNPKIALTYHDRILSVKFFENAVIDASDIDEIYEYGKKKTEGRPYCIMFEAEAHFDVTEEGLGYMLNNPHDKEILAKVYVLNTREAQTKAGLHLKFDNPALRPYTFATADEGMEYLKRVLKEKG